MPESRYSDKRVKPVIPNAGQHARRCCDRCSRPLCGARGHGWPTANGRGILCDYCEFPATAPKRGRIHIPEAEFADRNREFTRA